MGRSIGLAPEPFAPYDSASCSRRENGEEERPLDSRRIEQDTIPSDRM
jgi:hypothetical protein